MERTSSGNKFHSGMILGYCETKIAYFSTIITFRRIDILIQNLDKVHFNLVYTKLSTVTLMNLYKRHTWITLVVGNVFFMDEKTFHI